ncbi:MAG: FecR domain-containing protein [Bacteroidales bacterium]|nr:FecR domain-containing protein [Bacteroidales bacterium]
MKYLDGKADLEEKRQLHAFLNNHEGAREELLSTYKQWTEEREASFDSYQSLDRVLDRFSHRRTFRIPALAVAAAAIAVLFILVPFKSGQRPATPAPEEELYTWPESDEPMVLLSDGQEIRSDALEMQVSCSGGSIRIDGKEYSSSADTKDQYLLVVPYGHRAKVQFADGSSVNLNSHSRILFPACFGKERNVRITGEALFDVSRDESRPFTVVVDDVRVRVLGTRFLVSGNQDESHRVALVSGSVNVSLGDSGAQSVTLMPNQMYTLDDNGKINVEDVPDWRGLFDWADGVYRADGTSMLDLLSYLSRYYGEKVECDARVADIACTGTLYLRSTLSDMLSELSGIFSIKSRKQDGVWFVSLSSK